MITSLLPFFNIKKFTSYHENHLDKATKICYTYDNKGNILTKSVSGAANPKEISYSYREGTDRLMSFDGETFVYDNLDNPTTYRNKAATWVRGRCLESFDGDTYTYDAGGIRTSKTSGGITTNYIYQNGKLLRQTTNTESIDFIYGSDGMIGFRVNGGANPGSYLYRKNLFGDITQIYTANGELVGKYSYTAFGECTITQDTNGIATLNPIRYRSYYYDTQTNLYYLKTRYYDPETGRFITIDDTQYLAPDQINGLNLYAYCGNNAVMRIDPNGNAWWEFWKWDWGKIAITAGIVVAAIGAVALTVVTLGSAAPLLAAGIIGGIAAFSINVISQGVDKGYNNVNWGEVAIQTISGIAYGVASVALPGIGGMFVKAGIGALTTVASELHSGNRDAGSIIAKSLFSFGLSMGLQGAMKLGILDKLNFSHLVGKGRWVDFVSNKAFDASLIAMDFGNYIVRELTVAGVKFGAGLFAWVKSKIIGG